MTRSSCLTLVVPGLLDGTTPEQLTVMSAGSLLGRIAGRGAIDRRWAPKSADEARLLPWQRGVLAALKLDERMHPSASLTALGESLQTHAGHWLHAQPIHLAAGLNDVSLVPLRGELALTSDEVVALTPRLAEHFASTRTTVERISSNEWLLCSATDWNVETVTVDFARNHEWGVVLPQGSGAGNARRVMTEIQMLLHDHPVNEHRSVCGVPSANAVWLWGGGSSTPRASQRSAVCVGSHAYVRGICRVNDWPEPMAAASAHALIESITEHFQIVAIVEVDTLQNLESQWLAPLLSAMSDGAFARLELVLDGWHLSIDRWQSLRFWRRNRSPVEWSKT